MALSIKLINGLDDCENLRTINPILFDPENKLLFSDLPQVYSEISKSAFNSEAGRYYLLDSIEGHSNA